MLLGRRRGILAPAVACTFLIALLYSLVHFRSHGWRLAAPFSLDAMRDATDRFEQAPIRPPFKDQFWELGQRCRQLTAWINYHDSLSKFISSGAVTNVAEHIERATLSLFPFFKPSTQSTLSRLRGTKGTRGIVIPAGGPEAPRFAAHLIASLRRVLGCKLPIQVAYAGESDLPKAQRDILASLGDGIEFVDVTQYLEDEVVQLAGATWAIKAFAALLSPFAQTILIDADAVFLQSPERLFQQPSYRHTGAYLFHDRLLWQHAFRERHDWWKDQIKEPSPAMNKSLVWTEDYAEECDSGVVVVDKARNDVLVGLLHVAWQNTEAVREEVSYRLAYGDKETWWLGLELAGANYAFEPHYGAIVGWEGNDANETSVCSFSIAHVDDRGKLIWYNGSLLKNKRVDPLVFDVPTSWMVDGTWIKGATKEDLSCMVGMNVTQLSDDEMSVLRRSIEEAQGVDVLFKL